MKITRRIGKYLFAGFFVTAGLAHFLKTDVYMRAVPSFVPWARMAVILSGAAAFILGAALLVPKLSRAAAWGILVFLAAVFPSNLWMALHPEIFPKVPPFFFWLRLPLQALLMFWAYRLTLRCPFKEE